MTASKLINLNSCCINEDYVHPAFIILYLIAKCNPITVLRNISTSLFAFFFVYLSGKKNVRFVYCFFLCTALLSQSSVFPVISISGCLLFFSCNQTRRFISVALKHHRNQFPSPLPCGRAAVGDTPVHAFNLPTHSLKHQNRRTWHTHAHRGANMLASDSPHHCFLTSYLFHLCNIHLSSLAGPGSSIHPFYLYPRSVSPLSTATSSPLLNSILSFLKNSDGILCMWMVAILMRRARDVPDTGHRSRQALICDQCQ